MMDKNAIKNNGILEQYLLGELSREQRAEVDAVLREDVSLREYFSVMEQDFEKVAFENAITPPSHIKASLLDAIKDNTTKTTDDQKIISINKKDNRSLWIGVAASLAFLFLLSSGWLYLQWQNTQYSLQVVQNETIDLKNRLVDVEKNLTETNKWYTAINEPDMLQFVLKGNKISPSSKAVTYVNHKTKTVIVNPQQLAKLDADKTYQMWADVDGEMIDMGIIAKDKQMMEMKYIENAVSINITIEPVGGNDHPTVENLISNVLL